MARAPKLQDFEALPEADRLEGFPHPRERDIAVLVMQGFERRVVAVSQQVEQQSFQQMPQFLALATRKAAAGPRLAQQSVDQIDHPSLTRAQLQPQWRHFAGQPLVVARQKGLPVLQFFPHAPDPGDQLVKQPLRLGHRLGARQCLDYGSIVSPLIVKQGCGGRRGHGWRRDAGLPAAARQAGEWAGGRVGSIAI